MSINYFYSFHKNIQFTVDTFDIDIYHKTTFTGQYLNYNSFVPWHYKVSWIRSLVHRAKIICSTPILFTKQINFIFDKLMSWNDFPLHVRKSLRKRFLSDGPPKTRTLTERPMLWLNLPFLGKEGDFLIKNFKRKILKNLDNINLKIIFKTNNVSMFCSNKDRIADIKKANVVYKFSCPGCAKTYIGKTERNLITRLNEHADGHVESAIHSHLLSCSFYHDVLSYFSIFHFNKNKIISYFKNDIYRNTIIIDQFDNWSQLLYLEAYYIKLLKPKLNTGVKASRELQLF